MTDYAELGETDTYKYIHRNELWFYSLYLHGT